MDEIRQYKMVSPLLTSSESIQIGSICHVLDYSLSREYLFAILNFSVHLILYAVDVVPVLFYYQYACVICSPLLRFLVLISYIVFHGIIVCLLLFIFLGSPILSYHFNIAYVFYISCSFIVVYRPITVYRLISHIVSFTKIALSLHVSPHSAYLFIIVSCFISAHHFIFANHPVIVYYCIIVNHCIIAYRFIVTYHFIIAYLLIIMFRFLNVYPFIKSCIFLSCIISAPHKASSSRIPSSL